MTVPIAFISDSQYSSEHRAWVLKLAGDFRARAGDAILHKWRLAAGRMGYRVREARVRQAHLVRTREFSR